MDDKLIKVLTEIAQDKDVVGVLMEALERGDILERCPGTLKESSRSLCPELCRKIWPDLITGQCPGHKPNRLEIAQAIVALSKVVKEPERTYRTGDVFRHGDVTFMLAVVSSGATILGDNIWRKMSLYGDYYHDKPCCQSWCHTILVLGKYRNSIRECGRIEYLNTSRAHNQKRQGAQMKIETKFSNGDKVYNIHKLKIYYSLS